MPITAQINWIYPRTRSLNRKIRFENLIILFILLASSLYPNAEPQGREVYADGSEVQAASVRAECYETESYHHVVHRH